MNRFLTFICIASATIYCADAQDNTELLIDKNVIEVIDNPRHLPEGYVYCEKCGFAHPYVISEKEAREILNSTEMDSDIRDYYHHFPAMIYQPLIFRGYQSLRRPNLSVPPFVFTMDPKKNAYDSDRYAGILYTDKTELIPDEEGDEILSIATDSLHFDTPELITEPAPQVEIIPKWLSIALQAQRLQDDMRYLYMIENPTMVDFAYWDLPVPPSLPEEDRSFNAFLESLNLPEIDKNAAVIPEFEHRRINWLHTIGGALQFSQAYISSNWYQGGNNHLALLFNVNWDVVLNNVYHPNLMFQSNFSYRLALNSNPGDALHRYSISQDLFQYNLKTGIKAFSKWFYSFNLQFKTQLFNSYPADSPNLGAQFLSPADFNVGLGMTYNLSKLKNKLKLGVSISPISYNLKTCISNRIDHLQFNIAADRKTASEIGSNAEITLSWDITPDISWKSRMFLFTDYHYFLADWENTINFNINKFLSTQFYIHPRYDSSSDFNISKWRYWSLKEILSFGLSYTFSTK